MKYPKISEYVKAIQNAGANLDRLTHLSPVLDDHGEPYHMSDVSSVVFKMQDKTTGKYYAVKCFTIDPSGCADAHLLNADEQNLDASSNSSSVKSLEKELLVLCQGKEEKYPVELMDLGDEESMSVFFAAYVGLSTKATDEELNEALTDEFGAIYSKDGRKLFAVPPELDGSYSIKEGTKIICDWAFSDRSSLSGLVIPDSITLIGEGAFMNCYSLKSLVIPDSVTSIGDRAFWGCRSLKSLVIPASVVNIKADLFYEWYGELECLSPYFICDNKVLFDKDKSTIIAFKDKDTTSYVIPDYVTSIGNGAFGGCKSLKSIVISDSVTCIGNEVFRGCESLKSLVLPDSVTSIGDRAFDGWNGDLKCLSPYFIYDNKVLFDKNKSRIIAFRNKNASSYVIPYSVTRIEERTFRGCDSLRSVVIPDSVTSIGIEAFRDCSSLSSIVIPDGVTSIGDRAFQGCGSLKSLVIPDSVTCIGNYAFGGCKYLSSLVIPDSVTSIGHHAFWDCNFPNDLKQELISRFGEKIFLVTF